ncbi:MAG TPA: hypothetical protein DCZ94_19160 [Lentisphaeria bacterium]|nr:MAG: hypothetical protein A2X48_08960 [Lentisphaerae bacterium GWF2_49_21]HBC89064.1 hypothetical protein [Lentisphaeria bacterium]
MQLVKAHAGILKLGQTVFSTSDIAVYLQVSESHANKMLSRLRAAGLLLHIRRGLWGIPGKIDPLSLPELLTFPYPAYVSLQSALYYHGIISQMPSIIYAVSLARTRNFSTPLGTVSIHHIKPDFFFGYENFGTGKIKMASAEKALLDFIYLGPAKSRIFKALPEFELARGFKRTKALKMLSEIKSDKRRNMVMKRFSQMLEGLNHDL